MNLIYKKDKPNILRDWDCIHSKSPKSPLIICYVNLLYVTHIQAKFPPSSIYTKEKNSHNHASKSTLSTATFSSACLPHEVWRP